MPDLSSKKSNYISRLKNAESDLLRLVGVLQALTLEGVSQAYIAPLGQAQAPGLADADFVGDNGYLDAAIFHEVTQTLQALDAQLRVNNSAILQSLYKMVG